MWIFYDIRIKALISDEPTIVPNEVKVFHAYVIEYFNDVKDG